MLDNIKYYDDKENHGMIIDWKYIFKEFRKLNIPFKTEDENGKEVELYDPTTAPVTTAKYITLLSERASAKTTNWCFSLSYYSTT